MKFAPITLLVAVSLAVSACSAKQNEQSEVNFGKGNLVPAFFIGGILLIIAESAISDIKEYGSLEAAQEARDADIARQNAAANYHTRDYENDKKRSEEPFSKPLLKLAKERAVMLDKNSLHAKDKLFYPRAAYQFTLEETKDGHEIGIAPSQVGVQDNEIGYSVIKPFAQKARLSLVVGPNKEPITPKFIDFKSNTLEIPVGVWMHEVPYHDEHGNLNKTKIAIVEVREDGEVSLIGLHDREDFQ